ncbi:GntR family transcriptional regulator [Clostridium sp. KNHs214]|uniref:GntR family transcriptional regulator n=1 Tax=Clostridium sp. KNHs214 TaxID=1540257 RepID=UPI0016396AD4|nr:GntR family transcriptional regulator [Clostridium sp. KNHs214]
MLRKICKDSPLPLYYQIKQLLLDMIEDGELIPGELIPPEREICQLQEVSRMTVNKAIMSLVNEGVLYREQGKGTFVACPKEKQQLQLKGFTEQMEEKGLKSSSKIISFNVKKATNQIKCVLKLPKDQEEVIEINRLRIIEQDPYALEKVFIPCYMCPGLTKESLEGKSLYEILREKYNFNLKFAKQTIEPIMLNEFESKLLNQEDNSLALVFKRTTYLENDMPIEHTREIYRSDKYKYEIVLT